MMSSIGSIHGFLGPSDVAETVNQDGPRHRTLWAVVDGCGW